MGINRSDISDIENIAPRHYRAIRETKKFVRVFLTYFPGFAKDILTREEKMYPRETQDVFANVYNEFLALRTNHGKNNGLVKYIIRRETLSEFAIQGFLEYINRHGMLRI